MAQVAHRVARRYLIAREMTWNKALEVLGFPSNASPSKSEVQQVYRSLAKKLHPDLGGDPEAMVELNIAKDILVGDREPLGETPSGGSSWSEGSGGFKPEPFKEEVVTFGEAKNKANIPNSRWLFVTQPVSSGYRTDTSTRYASGSVVVGERESTWDFVVIEHTEDASYYVGGGYRYDMYVIKTMSIPKKGPADARTLYGGVLKAWKLFDRLEKRFNSKVIPVPEGWIFSNHVPKEHPVSIKNFLLNTGRVEEDQLGTPRKYTIEVHFESGREEKPGFFKYRFGDWIKLSLVINGRDFDLTEAQGERLSHLRIGGILFLNRVFGKYLYEGGTKSLSRNRDGKRIMTWMVNHLDLPTSVQTALKAAAAA